jgi:hypothetical protein
MSTEELAQQAADSVRDVIAAAERRAEEIVREAEAEAERIRAGATAETPSPPVPHPDPSPPGDPVPEPTPPEPAPPAPTPPTPDPTPPAPDPAPPTTTSNGAATGDAAVRLLAMKLALDGGGRDEIASALETKFGAADRGALLDDVLARAGR